MTAPSEMPDADRKAAANAVLDELIVSDRTFMVDDVWVELDKAGVSSSIGRRSLGGMLQGRKRAGRITDVGTKYSSRRRADAALWQSTQGFKHPKPFAVDWYQLSDFGGRRLDVAWIRDSGRWYARSEGREFQSDTLAGVWDQWAGQRVLPVPLVLSALAEAYVAQLNDTTFVASAVFPRTPDRQEDRA